MKHFIASIIMLVSSPAFGASPQIQSPEQLDCNIGSVKKTYGGSLWSVYACNDGHSVTIVSTPGSKATPFLFMFHWENAQYQLTGVGTGNKAATDAAFSEIRTMQLADILRLLDEAKKSAEHL